MFDDDDPTKSAEDKMSDAIVDGCIFAFVTILIVGFLIATAVKVWL